MNLVSLEIEIFYVRQPGQRAHVTDPVAVEMEVAQVNPSDFGADKSHKPCFFA